MMATSDAVKTMLESLKSELGEAKAIALLQEAMGISPTLARKVNGHRQKERQEHSNGEPKNIYTYTHEVHCCFCKTTVVHTRKVTKEYIKEDTHPNKAITGLTCMVHSYTRRCAACLDVLHKMEKAELEALCYDLLGQRQFLA